MDYNLSINSQNEKKIIQSLKNKIKIQELNDFTMLMKEENINGFKTR